MNQIDRRSCSEDEGGETSAPAVEPQAGNVSLCRSRGHSNPVTRKVAQEVNMKTGAGQSTSVKQADVSSCSNSFLRLALVVFWVDGGCYQDESGESDEKETGGRCEFNHWNFADHCILNFPGKKKGQQGNGGPQGQFIGTHPIAVHCKILSGAERPPQRPSHLQNRCTDLAEPKRENFEGGKIQSSVKEQVLNSFSCHVMYFDEVRCVLFVLCYVLFGFCFRLLIMGGSLAGRFTAWSCPWDVSSRWSGKWWAPKPSECQMDSNVLCDVNMNRSQTTRRAARRRVARNCLLGRRSLGPSAQFVRASKTNYQPRTFFESLFGCEVVSVQRHHAVSADCLKGQSPSGPHETDVLMILILATI